MNILITGASSGIGRDLAIQFSKEKDNSVLVLSRSEERLRTLSDSSEFNNISYGVADINKLSKEPQKLLKLVTDCFSRVDIYINNAGVIIPKKFEDLTIEEDDLVIGTNFTAPMRMIRTLLPIISKRGHVVNISSMAGFQGSSKYPGLAVYSAVKGAISVLTESLAKEYIETGPAFNALALGAVQTEMLNQAFPGFKAPLQPSEMAEFIVWFAVNGNKYFNGRNLPVTLANP